MNSAPELYILIANLLVRAGIDARPEAVTLCSRGGNNRTYRVETAAGIFAAKQYFRHEGDSRDRLAAEYAFLTYAKAVAAEATPRPFACDPEAGLALYEFVEGRPFQAGEIGITQVDAAIQFFRALNVPHLRATAQLQVASEAGFSIADHLALIERRINRLLEIIPQSEMDSIVLDFFRQLDTFWRQLLASVYSDVSRAGLNLDAPLAQQQRCISPSDFGFHNALTETNGNIRFLDFEYAGWDDPAKTAGDFFAQLAVPVPPEHYDYFVAECMRIFPESDLLAIRANILRPVYQIKWCCIALNVFMQVHLSRRKFANPGLDETALKKAQLAKAEQILKSIQTIPYGLH
jgi:hypothetical protein